MGALISRFKKSKTTVEVLEDIDKDILHLEKFRKANQELRQKVIGKLIFYSVILYIAGALTIYFFFMSEEWAYKIYGFLPLLLFPFLVYALKRFLHWFFVRKISQNEGELQVLRDQRKEILENVMETETYKKAKEILEKFDPETKRKLEEERNKREETRQQQQTATTPQSGLRRRQVPPKLAHPGPSNGLQMGRGHGMSPLPVRSSTPGGNPSTPVNGQPALPRTPVSHLPRPILPLNKTPLDKLMDYMIGDGATQRYALICRYCCSHNGMALKEEFQYLAFRCAYCQFFNPARKQRPNAPPLPMSNLRLAEPGMDESNASKSDDDTADSLGEPPLDADTNAPPEAVADEAAAKSSSGDEQEVSIDSLNDAPAGGDETGVDVKEEEALAGSSQNLAAT